MILDLVTFINNLSSCRGSDQSFYLLSNLIDTLLDYDEEESKIMNLARSYYVSISHGKPWLLNQVHHYKAL